MAAMARWAVTAALPLAAGCAMFGRPPVETPEQAAARSEQEVRIRAEVEARLAHEPSLDAGQLRVEVAGTDVHLHGAVRGPGALRCALATAGLVRGVSLVVDYLVLQPGPRDVNCLAPRVLAREGG
jgi:hypothetical protein